MTTSESQYAAIVAQYSDKECVSECNLINLSLRDANISLSGKAKLAEALVLVRLRQTELATQERDRLAILVQLEAIDRENAKAFEHDASTNT